MWAAETGGHQHRLLPEFPYQSGPPSVVAIRLGVDGDAESAESAVLISGVNPFPMQVECECVLAAVNLLLSNGRPVVGGDDCAGREQVAIVSVDNHLPTIGPIFVWVVGEPANDEIVVITRDVGVENREPGIHRHCGGGSGRWAGGGCRG